MFSIPEFQASIYDIYHTPLMIFITAVSPQALTVKLKMILSVILGDWCYGPYLQAESYSEGQAGYTADPEPNQKQQFPARGFHYKHLCNGKTHSWMTSYMEQLGHGLIKHLLQQRS